MIIDHVLASAETPEIYIPCAAEPAASAINPYRFGAHVIEDGVDFSVFAGHARNVDVCLFENIDGGLRETRFAMNRGLYGTWHAHIPGISHGCMYGFRVSGEWNPSAGKLFNPAKVLLDPYSRAIGQSPHLHSALYSHVVDENYDPDPTWRINNQDSARVGALGVVLPEGAEPVAYEAFLNLSNHVRIPWNETVIYEAHVISLTKNNSDIPPELRGTYAGVAHPRTIEYLKNLGITSLELLPIHAKMSEPFLTVRGLENYWGYNTLSYFAPEPSYATAASRSAGPRAVIDEFKAMVARLHDAGIEVILDVVYNHTCEAGSAGPTLHLRGLDSRTYYRHDPQNPGKLIDTTGCGNSLDFTHIRTIQLTLDSLRYWVNEMGIDGFRFDLAATLSRRGDEFDPSHPLYVAMTSDPMLSQIKLINEPWDIGPNGWQTGNFHEPTADWNDHFRDSLRSYWLSQPAEMFAGGSGADLRDIATRLSGSVDLFGHGALPGGRGIYSSVNFITAHDGFTLRDLTSYNTKHNEANGEENRDGSNFNGSWNHGVEGDKGLTDDIAARRRISARNLMAALLVSGGTPMITSGDEVLKTQNGNNNAYCQNSPISYLEWDDDVHARDMYATTAYLLRLRREHPALRPSSFYTGTRHGDDVLLDLEWFDSSGHRMPDYKWFDPSVRVLQMLRSGALIDDDTLVVFNGSPESAFVTLPEGRSLPYTLVWDSAWEHPSSVFTEYEPGSVTKMHGLTTRIYLARPTSD